MTGVLQGSGKCARLHGIGIRTRWMAQEHKTPEVFLQKETADIEHGYLEEEPDRRGHLPAMQPHAEDRHCLDAGEDLHQPQTG